MAKAAGDGFRPALRDAGPRCQSPNGSFDLTGCAEEVLEDTGKRVLSCFGHLPSCYGREEGNRIALVQPFIRPGMPAVHENNGNL
jgi:hypothetical protein